MMKFLESNIFHSFAVSPKDISLYRIIFCAYVLLVSGLPSFTWMDSDLNYYFMPPEISFAALFAGFPSQKFFIALTLINIISFFFIFWGLFTKWSSIIFTLSYLAGSNFGFSFGKIDHGFLMYLTPVFIGFLGWGHFYSIDSLRKKDQVLYTQSKRDSCAFVLAIFALLIGFGYATAGLSKLFGGWWKWDIEAVKSYLDQRYYTMGRTKYLAGYFVAIHNHLFWKLLDYLTLIFELCFIIAAINIRVFRYFLGAAVIFHCLIFLMYNITFSGNLIAYMAFIDWQKMRCFLQQSIGPVICRITFKALIVATVPLTINWIYSTVSMPDLLVHNDAAFQFVLYAMHLDYPKSTIVFSLSIPVLLALVALHFKKPEKQLT